MGGNSEVKELHTTRAKLQCTIGIHIIYHGNSSFPRINRETISNRRLRAKRHPRRMQRKVQCADWYFGEHMPEVAQSGKPLVDEQSVSGTMDLVVKPMMIEYSFLTNPKKGYKAPASGYKGTFLNSEMNNYSYTQGNLIDKQDPNGPRMIPRTL